MKNGKLNVLFIMLDCQVKVGVYTITCEDHDLYMNIVV